MDKVLKYISSALKFLFILPVRAYQFFLSPLLGANKCRYEPTCSYYMIDAINEWGILKGTWLGIKRIFRCHPWGGFGPDPVPKRKTNADQARL
ncbi:MAG: membrane protein insertion efficiency factor YidD [Saprospiraceae bacterium]